MICQYQNKSYLISRNILPFRKFIKNLKFLYDFIIIFIIIDLARYIYILILIINFFLHVEIYLNKKIKYI